MNSGLSKSGLTLGVTCAAAWLVLGTGLACAQPVEAPTQNAANASAQEPPNAEQSTPKATVTTVTGIVVTAPHYVPQGSETAAKTNIPLIQVPQSISVITRDQIDLLNFTDLQQAVRYTAGVTGENFGSDLRYDFISVRGFTPRQFIDGLAAPATTTISSVGVDLYAFDSVEILKGPSSVLYGLAPPGGIFNEISRRASNMFGGELQAKYGSWDYKEVEGTVTGPISEGISGRLTALFLDRGAQRDFVRAQRELVAPTVTFKFGDTVFTPLFYYQHDLVKGDTNGFLPVVGTLLPDPLGQISPSANFGEPSYNHYDRNQFGIGYELDHHFSNDLQFVSNFKYSGYREDSRVIYGAGLEADNRTLDRFNFPYKESVYSIATDNRLDARFDTGALSHKFLVGVDYRNVHNNSAFGFTFATPIDIYHPVYSTTPIASPGTPYPFSNIRLQQTGTYAQDQIRIGHLYILLGGRYDWVSMHNLNASTTTDQQKFTYRIGANYLLDNGFAPYIGYATSFEPVQGTDSVTGRTFKPTTGEQIEGGLKYTAKNLGPDVRLFASIAGFDIKQKNVVTIGSSIVPVFGTQSGAVEVYGAEIEVVGRFFEQLSINASYSYNHSRVTQDLTNPLDVGAPLPVTPRNKLAGFVDYTFRRGPLGGFGFGAGLRYLSSSAGSLPGPFNPVVYYSHDPVLIDAMLHYDTPGWRFALNASNLADRRYVSRCDSASDCDYGAGRQIMATVTKKF